MFNIDSDLLCLHAIRPANAVYGVEKRDRHLSACVDTPRGNNQDSSTSFGDNRQHTHTILGSIFSTDALFWSRMPMRQIKNILIHAMPLARAFLLYSPTGFIDNKYLHSAIVDLTAIVLFAPHRSCGHRTFGHRNLPCHATGDIYLAIAEDCGVKVPLGLPSAHRARRMTTGFCTDVHIALSPWWIPSSPRVVFGGQIKVQDNGIRIVGKAPNYWP